MRVGGTVAGNSLPYLAVTDASPPLPPCRSSVTLQATADHLAYSVALPATSQTRALLPAAV